MRILSTNKVTYGTLTYSSQRERYQFLTAFGDIALSRWAKWSGNSAQWLQCTFPSSENVYYSAILKANMSESATVKLQCSSDNFASVAEEHAYSKYGEHWIARFDTPLKYRYYRLFVTDASVTYPRISKWYLGGYIQMPGPTEISTSRKSSAMSDKTDTGQAFGYSKTILESLNVSFTVESDEKAAINEYFTEYDKITPAIVILYEDTPEAYPPLYANMTSDLEWKKVMSNGETYQIEMKWEECK